MSPAAAALLAGLGGALAGAGWLMVLPRLREPVTDQNELKTPYRSLATGRAAAVVAALTAGGVLLPALSLPTQVLPLWVVLAVFGVPLACVDAATTWLPASVTRVGWAAMVGAALLTVALGGNWTEPARAVAGGAAAGAPAKPRKRGGSGGGSGASGDSLTSPMQGTIVKVAVEDGATVAAGDLVVVLEAMKMEQPITAHKAGTISGLSAEVGASVTSGAVICTIADAAE